MRAWYYQQFDADFAREIPAEGYGGWKQADLPIRKEETALVVMHAWDTGTRELFPGWHRAVEYIPRADHILREVFPPLLAAVRAAGWPVFHVVGGGNYYQHLPGYQARHSTSPRALERDPLRLREGGIEELLRFRSENVFVGRHNEADVRAGFARLDFPEQARPQGAEGIAEDSEQLAALASAAGVSHLVYVGFALNWCLLLSPGGMVELSRLGYLCSTIREATTAVENAESARTETAKALALWRVALAFGFVFDLADFLEGLA
ncbi:isochorismatase family protein [Armatimonas rosea]|uniref:Nicotinamidase-related amidase n=1 Tax=Armatimonas rosea TaxID=685828 RepID=A0A7W9SV59_ARMRO|nr:isochorismatase family protein [Armatimonas rosea]MBB6052529.1 nicotinamidase-related amidase [Armatimonas rosea]